jgi:hypothetical protein
VADEDITKTVTHQDTDTGGGEAVPECLKYRRGEKEIAELVMLANDKNSPDFRAINLLRMERGLAAHGSEEFYQSVFNDRQVFCSSECGCSLVLTSLRRSFPL